MQIVPILKSVTDIVVSVGAGAVVGNAIKASTPADIKTINKVSIAVGGMVLSGMTSDAASKYATERIDITLKQIKDLRLQFNQK